MPIEGFVDGLDVVGVVICEFGVEGLLDEEIDTAVDDTQGVEVDDELFACFIDGLVCDELVLLLEVGSKGRSVSSAVLFTVRRRACLMQDRSQPTDSVKIDIPLPFGL